MALNIAKYTDMNEAYHDIYSRCIAYGERSEHRGGPCVELRPFSFTLANPSRGLFTGAARRMNYRFWAAETLCYLAGWGEVEAHRCAELLICLNSNYSNFSGEQFGEKFLYPMVRYGDALGPGLARCWDTLTAKPSSRQAYVSIHDRDTPHTHQDLPCGASVQYMLTRGVYGVRLLSALYMIRSNDLNWGMPYDVASNCALQLTLAGSLGLPAGEYHHVTGSMHYYEENDRTPLRPPAVSPPADEEWLEHPPRIPHPTHMVDIRVYQAWAGELLLQMHEHFAVNGGTGNKFALRSTDAVRYDNHWLAQWVDVIRWRHPK